MRLIHEFAQQEKLLLAGGLLCQQRAEELDAVTSVARKPEVVLVAAGGLTFAFAGAVGACHSAADGAGRYLAATHFAFGGP